jgi:hypothetical protein
MFFCGFQIYDHRGEALSSWIPAESITALISTNGSAASHLIQSLYRFSPASLDLERPITNSLLTSSHSRAPLACCAKFHIFKKEELEALCWAAYPERGSRSESFESQSGISLPKSVGLMVSRTQAGKYFVEFDVPLPEGLDSSLARAWVLQNMPSCVHVNGFSLFSGRADLAQIARKLDANASELQLLSSDERIALSIVSLAGLDVRDLLSNERSATHSSLSAQLAKGTMQFNRSFQPPCPEFAARFDLRIDGTILDVFVEDLAREELIHLENCSPSLRWSVSLFSQLSCAVLGGSGSCVLLLESLGVHFNPEKHGELLDYIEKISASNSVLFTTHQATMIRMARPERIVALACGERESFTKAVPLSDPAAPRLLLQQALGMGAEAADASFGRPTLILTNRFSEELLRSLSAAMRGFGAESLSEGIHLQSCSSPENLPTFANLKASQGSRAAVLLETDSVGEALLHKLDRALITDKRLSPLMIGDAAELEQNEATLEDLFPMDFLLDCVTTAYGTKINPKDLPSDGSDSLGKRIAATTRRLGIKEEKTERLLPVLQQQLRSMSSKADFPKGTFEKTKRLFSAINAASGFSADAPARAPKPS